MVNWWDRFSVQVRTNRNRPEPGEGELANWLNYVPHEQVNCPTGELVNWRRGWPLGRLANWRANWRTSFGCISMDKEASHGIMNVIIHEEIKSNVNLHGVAVSIFLIFLLPSSCDICGVQQIQQQTLVARPFKSI